MRELLRAAQAARGCARDVLQDLGINSRVLMQRLSILRKAGVAQTITIYDPRALGANSQSTFLVKLSSLRLTEIASFEDLILRDAAVTSAQRMSGDYDYRLVTYHSDAREVSGWSRTLRDRPEVAKVLEAGARPLFGHDLPGVVVGPLG